MLKKLYAGVCVFMAFIAVMQFVPKQTVVVGPDKKATFVRSDTLQSKGGTAPGMAGKASLDKTHAPAAAADTPATPDAQAKQRESKTAGAVNGTDAPQNTSGAAADASDIDVGGQGLAAALPEEAKSEERERYHPMAPKLTRTDRPEGYQPPKPENSKAKARLHAEDGIPDSHASVAPVLAAHPDRDLILCLAGCGGRVSIVEIRKPSQVASATSGELIPTSAGQTSADTGDIVCLAGCAGKAGEVVFRNARLAWISDEGSSQIKAMLRAIADRVSANEAVSTEEFARTWVSAAARAHLTGETEKPVPAFTFASPQVANWMRQLAVTAFAERQSAVSAQ